MADGIDKKPGLIRRAVQSATDLVKSAAREVAQLDFFARFKCDGAVPEIDFPIDVGRDTIWATQQQMADLFGVNQPDIAKHIKSIFDKNELPDNEATHSKMELVQNEGGRSVACEISHYSLDVIFTVGYRVNGTRAAEFRQWATRVLRGYVEEGYALNGRRLQSDPAALQRLAEEVRAIRTSEKALYQRVRDTFALCAVDYEPSSKAAQSFFRILKTLSITLFQSIQRLKSFLRGPMATSQIWAWCH
ncbi:virulence RhuM family protein [Methylobacterium sp. J-077]|nr:RhuM family protein [Methylobacterium sp. J-077]MCJ2121168.1 virulence RhuM family protein [Methylobacterium sp. J-077]